MRDFSRRFYKQYNTTASGGEIDDGIRIISVQSAKGGVGKTLFSLLLGNRILHPKDQGGKAVPESDTRVFLIDLDFGGTSLSDLLEPAEEKKDKSKREKEAKSANGTSLHHIPIFNLADLADCELAGNRHQYNLLDLFQEDLKGNSDAVARLPALLANHPEKWDTPGDRRICLLPSGKFNSNSTINGSLLFDAMHGEWFCEFLFELIFRLYQADPGDKSGRKRNACFILDNGPGWTELLPLLQNYLLKWGVHRAKFLHVTSADQMDIDASFRMLLNLYNSYLKIYYTKRYCVSLQKKPTEYYGNIDNEFLDQDYLYELLGENDFNKAPEDLCSLTALLKVHCDDRDISRQISDFMGLVLNRVFPIINLHSLEAYVEDKFKRLTEAYQKGLPGESAHDNNGSEPHAERFLSALPVVPVSSDPSLALMYQEHFIEEGATIFVQEPAQDKGLKTLLEVANSFLNCDDYREFSLESDKTDWNRLLAEGSETARSSYNEEEIRGLFEVLFSNADTGGEGLRLNKSEFRGKLDFYLQFINSLRFSLLPYLELQDLVLLDRIKYKEVCLPVASFLQRKLIGLRDLENFSHLYQASSVLFDLFRVCTYILKPLYKTDLGSVLPTADHLATLQIYMEDRIIGNKQTSAESELSTAACQVESGNGEKVKERDDIKPRADGQDDWLKIVEGFLHESLSPPGITYSIPFDLEQVAKHIKELIAPLTTIEQINGRKGPPTQNIARELFIFFFIIYTGIIICRSSSHGGIKTSFNAALDNVGLNGCDDFIKRLCRLSWHFIQMAQYLDKDLPGDYNYIHKGSEDGTMSIGILDTSIELRSICFELKSFIRSLQLLEKKHHFFIAAWKAFTMFRPISQINLLYILDSIKDILMGNRIDVGEVMKIAFEVLNGNRSLSPDKRRLGNSIRAELELADLLEQWGII